MEQGKLQKIMCIPLFTIKQFQPERDRLHELFRLLNTHEDLENVFIYLKNAYPNTDRENEQQRINRVVSVRGGFPKLPPNYVTRKSLVSTKNMFFKSHF